MAVGALMIAMSAIFSGSIGEYGNFALGAGLSIAVAGVDLRGRLRRKAPS
jgi:hypothetical protein